MELAEAVGVPGEILASSTRADPLCGRPPEMAEIPFTTVDLYLQIRAGLRSAAELETLSTAHVEYLSGLYRRNRFKAELPLRPPVFEAKP
jgi:hypothetical protein